MRICTIVWVGILLCQPLPLYAQNNDDCGYATREDSVLKARERSQKIWKAAMKASTVEEVVSLQEMLEQLTQCLNTTIWNGEESPITSRDVRSEPTHLAAMLEDRMRLVKIPDSKKELQSECEEGKVPEEVEEGLLQEDDIPFVKLETFIKELNEMEYFDQDPAVVDAKKDLNSGSFFKSCACRSAAYLEAWSEGLKHWNSSPGKTILNDRAVKLTQYRAICSGSKAAETKQIKDVPPPVSPERTTIYRHDNRSENGEGGVAIELKNCVNSKKQPYTIWVFEDASSGTKLKFLLPRALEFNTEFCEVLHGYPFPTVVFYSSNEPPSPERFAVRGETFFPPMLMIDLSGEKEIGPDLPARRLLDWISAAAESEISKRAPR